MTASLDGNSARVWDAQAARSWQGSAMAAAVTAAAFSPDGTRIVTASQDNTARVWDATTGKELARLGHDGGV